MPAVKYSGGPSVGYWSGIRRALIGAVITLGLTVSAQAGLQFEEKIIELASSPKERSVAGTFRFKNDGDAPVTIRKVHTTCGCTTAKLSQTTFQPGETGQIDTVFKYGFARGPLRKLLSVELADGTELPLEIRVTVEAPVQASPTLVYWRQGQSAESKEIAIEVGSGFDAAIGPVESDDENFTVTMKKNGEKNYTLAVTPRSTADRAKARIRLTTRVGDAQPELLTIYARVQ